LIDLNKLVNKKLFDLNVVADHNMFEPGDYVVITWLPRGYNVVISHATPPK